VLTHHARGDVAMDGGTTFPFVTDDIHAALASAREAAHGRDNRIGGGASTLRQFLIAEPVHELHLAQSPAHCWVRARRCSQAPTCSRSDSPAPSVLIRRVPPTWC
jgi:dihydrofolate reductase